MQIERATLWRGEILQIMKKPFVEGEGAWTEAFQPSTKDEQVLQDAQQPYDDNMAKPMSETGLFGHDPPMVENTNNVDRKGKSVADCNTFIHPNLDTSSGKATNTLGLDTWDLTPTAKPPHTDYPINSREMDLLMSNEEMREMAKAIFNDPEYWEMPTWEQNKFSIGRATHGECKKHWKDRIGLFQPEWATSRNKNNISPRFLRLLIGEFVLKWQVDYSENGKEGPVHANVWAIAEARKSKKCSQEGVKVPAAKKVKRETTRSTPNKPCTSIDEVIALGGGALSEHFNAGMAKASVQTFSHGTRENPVSLFQSAATTPDYLLPSQSTTHDTTLCPPKTMAEVRSRLDRLGEDMKTMVEDKLLNTYKIFGIYDYSEVDKLRNEVLRLQEDLLKERRMNARSNYEAKPPFGIHGLTSQATKDHEATIAKLCARVEMVMDEKDVVKAELKEAKLDIDEKCKTLQNMEHLMKAKDKDIMAKDKEIEELKAKLTSTTCTKESVENAGHQKTIRMVDVTADSNPLWPDDAEQDDNKGWSHINNFDIKQKGVPDHVSSGQRCTACLNPFGPESAAMLGACGHTFHHSCLQDWCSTRTKCWCNTPIHDQEFVQRGLDRALIASMESQADSETFAWSEPQPLVLETLPSNPALLNSQQFETLLHHGQMGDYQEYCRFEAPSRIQQNEAQDDRARSRCERRIQLEKRQQALDVLVSKRTSR